KSWPLHIEASWETLPNLDPEERRQEKAAAAERLRLGVTAMALGAARGTIVSDGGFALALETGQKVPLAESLTEAAERLLALENEKPALYDLAVAPLAADAAAAQESRALAEEAKAAAARSEERRVGKEG